MKLVIGNKNYSSWSLRACLALWACDVIFDEIVIPMYNGEADKRRILEVSPSGKVPVLIDGDITIWDSLAIIEYLAERFPDAGLWPEARPHRAHARAISAEMHGGFGALRRECGMNIHRVIRAKPLSDAARADIARVQDIWTDCRERYGKRGPYLFGSFSAADAMYAPVVHRFQTYAIEVGEAASDYMHTMLTDEPFDEWTKAAMAETMVIEKFETD